MEYKNAPGFHVTGELEVALSGQRDTRCGLKYYSVTYKVDTSTFNGASVPVPAEFRELTGDGVDITIGFGVLF